MLVIGLVVKGLFLSSVGAGSFVLLVRPNVLARVVAKPVGLSEQIAFQFSGPFTHTCVKDAGEVCIRFPKASADGLHAAHIEQELGKLSRIANVACKMSDDGIECRFAFKPNLVVVVPPKKIGFDRLICEVYTRKDFERIQKASTGPLFHA